LIYDLENHDSVIRFQVETINNSKQIFVYCPQNKTPTFYPLSVQEARHQWTTLISQGWILKKEKNV
jgi:hypothetical protein